MFLVHPCVQSSIGLYRCCLQAHGVANRLNSSSQPRLLHALGRPSKTVDVCGSTMTQVDSLMQMGSLAESERDDSICLQSMLDALGTNLKYSDYSDSGSKALTGAPDEERSRKW
jgi:hypothetical protein